MTLQLHTANIVAAHNTLEQKDKAIQDIKEQKNRYVLPFSQTSIGCLFSSHLIIHIVSFLELIITVSCLSVASFISDYDMLALIINISMQTGQRTCTVT